MYEKLGVRVLAVCYETNRNISRIASIWNCQPEMVDAVDAVVLVWIRFKLASCPGTFFVHSLSLFWAPAFFFNPFKPLNN